MIPFATEKVAGALITFALMAVMFWPMERAFAARPDQPVLRRAFRSDLAFFFGQQLLWGWLNLAVLSFVVARVDFAGLNALRGAFATLPWAARLGAVMLLGDLTVYFAHRLQHRSPLLWRFHSVHHTSTTLDWVAAHREHPLDGLYTTAAVNLPAVLLGFSLEGAAGLVVLRGIWAVFIHSNVRFPLGPLRWVLGCPEFHHWHHAKDGGDCNYGNLAPWTDVVFGTHKAPLHGPDALGIREPSPQGYLGLLAGPFLNYPGNGARHNAWPWPNRD